MFVLKSSVYLTPELMLGLLASQAHPQENHLSFNGHGLSLYVPEHVCALLNVIPPNFNILDLSNNFLGNAGEKDLTAFLKSVSHCVQHLILSKNYLFYLDEQLCVILSESLKPEVVHLDLGNNNLYKLSDFKGFIQGLPPLQELDISNNKLGDIAPELIAEAFQSFQKGLLKLVFRDNNLHKWTTSQIANLLSVLPEGIEYIDISSNGIEHRGQEEQFSLIAAAPVSVKSIKLYENYTVSPAQSLLENIIYNLQYVLLQPETAVQFSKYLIPFTPVNEKRISQLIDYAHEFKKESPYQNLLFGLLLTGEINSYCSNNHDLTEESEEKRTLCAIDYFIKAARSSFIRPFADYLLWKLKDSDMAMKYSSIKFKLERANLTPSTGYHQSGEHHVSMRHYLDELRFFSKISEAETKKPQQFDELPPLEFFTA